ncbi:PH domain-containing protein [Jatrophihabitans endophyticus]|uniref:PH domain-containing protein n=1 Tax=Jatrophihabitans endophyticus TaxID=1206085 RepID=UPI0013562D48|nr:PH domain-containing protein [Jatrophihabitans endophyticus]
MADTELVVDARPVKTARIANASALVAFLVFVVVALLMKRENAGAYFGQQDQIFTVVLGLIVAGGLRLPARPRLHADTTAVRTRGYLGNWRTIPWEAVVAVEFPKSVRFAQLRLPAEERLAIYAVQRMDGPYAVATMQQLRALFAATHPDED